MQPHSGPWGLPPLTLPIPLCFISCHSYHPSFTSSHTGLPAVPHKQEAHCCLRALELTVLSLEHSPHMLHGQGLLWGVHAKSLQPYPTISDPMYCSLPGSSVHGTLQARILEWVAFPSPGDLPDPGIEPESPVTPTLQADSLPLSQRGSPACACTSICAQMSLYGQVFSDHHL